MPAVIGPVVGHDDGFFWEGVAEGKLLLQRCADCGRVRQPPTPMCPNCRSLKTDTQQSTGKGTVYSWILSHHPTEPDAEPRIVVLVDLDEGVRLVSNLIEVDQADVDNGMAVEVCFRQFEGGVTLPQFRPAAR
jgi:uncharacterized OB-fold protein